MVLALAACGQRGVQVEAQGGEQQRAQHEALSAYQSWNLHARAIVRRPGESYHVGLQWKRNPGQFVMLLEAPFGQGVFRIDATADGGYRLSLPDGQLFENSTPEALLEDVFGWSMPISGMIYWIRGLPRPGSEYRDRVDASGYTRSIRQDRWAIEYKTYFEAATEPRLPRRMDLSRDNLNIKLVIEHWQQSAIEQQPADLFPEFD